MMVWWGPGDAPSPQPRLIQLVWLISALCLTPCVLASPATSAFSLFSPGTLRYEDTLAMQTHRVSFSSLGFPHFLLPLQVWLQEPPPPCRGMHHGLPFRRSQHQPESWTPVGNCHHMLPTTTRAGASLGPEQLPGATITDSHGH